MPTEATKKLIQADSPTVTAGLFIAIKYTAIFNLHDPGVGDGHLVHIRGEIANTLQAAANSLAIDIPVDAPDFGRDVVKPAGFYHQVTELGLKDFGQGHDRQEEIQSGTMPGVVFQR